MAGQTAIYGLSSIIGRLLNYLLVPLYTRIFAPAEYGVVTELYAYLAFFIVIYTYGMETSLFHFSEKENARDKVYGNALLSIVISSAGLSLLLVLFSPLLSSAIEYPHHPEYIRWLAIVLAADAITSIPFARLRQQNKAVKFAVLKLINISINIALNIFFLILCPKWLNEGSILQKEIAGAVYNPQTGVGYVFISNVISSALTLIMLLPEMMKVKWQPDSALLKRLLGYGMPLLIAGLAGMINESLSRIMLKYLLPGNIDALHELGIFGACYKLSVLMTLFVQTFRYAADPFFFSSQKQVDSKILFARVMNYFVIACCIIFLTVMLYIDVIKYFIGEQYWSGLNIVPVLLLANMFLGIFYNLSMWYKFTGQTQFGAWFTITGAVITVTGLYLLIPLYGSLGAAWTTLICYAAIMILSYITGQKYFPVNYQVWKILFYILLAVALFSFSKWLDARFSFSPSVSMLISTVLLFIYSGIALAAERKKPVFSRAD